MDKIAAAPTPAESPPLPLPSSPLSEATVQVPLKSRRQTRPSPWSIEAILVRSQTGRVAETRRKGEGTVENCVWKRSTVIGRRVIETRSATRSVHVTAEVEYAESANGCAVPGESLFWASTLAEDIPAYSRDLRDAVFPRRVLATPQWPLLTLPPIHNTSLNRLNFQTSLANNH